MNKPTAKPGAKPTGPANAWLLQCPPGLAMTLKKELSFVGSLDKKQQLFIKRQRNHDLIFANRLKDNVDMRRLRVAEIVMSCPVFGRYKVSQSQLASLAEALKGLGPRRLIVQVAGRVFDRRDLSRWLEKELSSRGVSITGDCEDEVWMFCIDESYYFGIPITKARESEGRDERTHERSGSLPAPIAAALVFSAQPKDSDVILDPVCGSGTLLAEAHFYAAGARRIGVDIDKNAIATASVNLGQSDGLRLFSGDSRRLRQVIGDAAATLVVANLPFGVQFGDRKNNPELYRAIIAESYALRGPMWRAVLLTSDIESLRGALSEFDMLKTQDLFRVKVRGELATAILLQSR